MDDATICSESLPLHACALEAVPGSAGELVVGLYELKEEEGARSGAIVHADVSKGEIRIKNVVDAPAGVLDLKWSGNRNTSTLGCVCANGQLLQYQLRDGMLQLMHETEAEDCIYLSLDHSSRGSHHADKKVAASTSDGRLIVWQMNDAGPEEVLQWSAHELFKTPIQAWITVFNAHDSDVLMSGGDDCKMKLWDIRAGTTRPISTYECGGGVTSGQWHVEHANYFISGSYDEQVRLWDVRAMQEPVKTYDAGGGVWRLKCLPVDIAAQLTERSNTNVGRNIVAVAAMRGGVPFLHIDPLTAADGETSGERASDVKYRYEGHPAESLAYGVDWVLVNNVDGGGCEQANEQELTNLRIASCSFYDNSLHVWQIPASL